MEKRAYLCVMKKIMMMVAVALMTAMNVNAQNENLRNELSLSYGEVASPSLAMDLVKVLA